MFEVLNMSLQVMRTVLKNEINEISVCSDMKRESGAFYTLISIKDDKIRREVIQCINSQRLFTANQDFVGSFTYQDSLNLVFLYRQENRFSNQEPMLARKFADRKQLASRFLAACAESGAEGSLGELLIQDCNIHINGEKKFYFNYFLDFSKYQMDAPPKHFFQLIADYAFGILSREYGVRYENDVNRYPQELQVFYKKKEHEGFSGFNQILTFIKLIPDAPREQHVGVRRLWDYVCDGFRWIKRHSMAIFITALILTTLIFWAYQFFTRYSIRKGIENNTSYIGMQQIGEVYLGDEDV